MIDDSTQKVPAWMTAVIVAAMLPGVAFPTMLNYISGDSLGGIKVFVWLYPVYVICAGWMAYATYRQRPALSWILVALLLLTHAAMWWLVLRGGVWPS